jgi:1-acyl-sn-glycerol-3-phosphate acyltransferase
VTEPELRTSRAATGRNISALVLRAWRLHVLGADLVPRQGPVLLAANHLGVLDGPALAVASPRPVHVLVKSEAYVPLLRGLFHATDQIGIDYEGPDRSALQAARRVLERGGVVGIFPEAHRGAGDVQHVRDGVAYLAAATGAPVVPVAVLGTRPPGAGKGALPPVGARLDVVLGAPLDIRVEGDPRRRAVLARSGERLRQVLADHVRDACARTGQTLPGHLPAPTAERSTP